MYETILSFHISVCDELNTYGVGLIQNKLFISNQIPR